MKTKTTGYLGVALILFSAACKVSKEVKLPNMQLQNTYRSAKLIDSAGIAKLPFKSFFTDVTLQEMIDSAIAKNNDLQIAVKNIEAARLQYAQSRLGNIPSVGLALTASSSRPSDNSLNGLSLSQFLGSKHIEDYTAAVNVSWEADIWSKIKSRKAAALASYLQTEEARKAVPTEVVVAVSKGYYNLLMLDAQLNIAKKNVALNDSTLRIIKLQYTAGQATSLAVQQADAQRLAAAKLIPQFEQELVIQENALSILSGKLPESVARNKKLDDIEVASTLSAGLPSDLLSLRPDIRSAELDVDRSNAEVGFSKARMYPSLTITAQGGVNAFKASNWFNLPASLFGAVAGGLTQPIFQRKELKTGYEVAKIQREKSVIQFRQQVLVAVGEVSEALIQMDKLDEQQIIARQRAKTLQVATGNASMLFKNGLANYLEVITAQSNVLQSELELASIKKARLNATIDLYRSVGGGWR